MATMIYDDAADLAIIQGKKVAILGYGSQGHAHALNLKDSGVDVRVGLAASSRSRDKARAAGLTVGEPGEVAKWADVVMVLVPDTTQAQLYKEQIAPHLKAGKALAFAHGFNIHFSQVTPPSDVRTLARGRLCPRTSIMNYACTHVNSGEPDFSGDLHSWRQQPLD